MWFVYVIECENGSLYTGIAKDPKLRFREHKAGVGAKYTRANKPVGLVYVEKVDNKSKALKRECEIKSWPRKKKIQELEIELDQVG